MRTYVIFLSRCIDILVYVSGYIRILVYISLYIFIYISWNIYLYSGPKGVFFRIFTAILYIEGCFFGTPRYRKSVSNLACLLGVQNRPKLRERMKAADLTFLYSGYLLEQASPETNLASPSMPGSCSLCPYTLFWVN